MNNEIQVFENAEFGSIRTVEIDGNVWFVGKDVAVALAYSEPHKAVKRHVDEDDRMKHPVTDNTGRKQDSWIINESGLYSLILSSKHTALSFQANFRPLRISNAGLLPMYSRQSAETECTQRRIYLIIPNLSSRH